MIIDLILSAHLIGLVWCIAALGRERRRRIELEGRVAELEDDVETAIKISTEAATWADNTAARVEELAKQER